ncbi:MAG: hypothetical protein CL840_16705 [Crocinitomicaceae bacterium]|nr:hypothetical protein [Crocinitomicaceae bacterium]|tara:strand:- start:13456 stop:14076 length:621 start_codon:yes stop_codon:yes gene_type:complete
MKVLVLWGLALFMSMNLAAQNYGVEVDSTKQTSEKQEPKKEKYSGKRTFIGGGFGLGFSQNSGFINVSPILGYNFSKNLQAAMKFTYWYNWGRAYDAKGGVHKYDGNIYAYSIFSRYVIFKGLFAHIEPEYMNLPRYEWSRDWSSSTGWTLEERRVDAFNFYVGGGFYQGFSGNSGGFVMLLYNLNETENSFYSNPYIQIGFTAGF